MKQWRVSIYILVLTVFSLSARAAQTDSVDAHIPRVLIVNSFCADTDASTYVINEITNQLKKQFNHIHIHVGHMNLNKVQSSSSPIFAMRSILWSYAYSADTTMSAEDLSIKSLFVASDRPDVLVFIGNDALLFFQSYGPIAGEWMKVPIVVCGASDEVAFGNWLPGTTPDFSSLSPVEDRRLVKTFFTERDKKVIDKHIHYVKGERDGQPGYIADMPYNLTGVKGAPVIRENLDLIRHLMPDLKEIIWIDNDYYSSNYTEWLLQQEIPEVLPDVTLTKIHCNQYNTDSIYSEMVKPVSGRAYLTCLWGINGMYSRFSDAQIQELFSENSTTPMFSLTGHLLSNPFWVGGYYKSYSEFASKAVTLINRILQGEPANAIPFETVAHGNIILDYSLLKKYHLQGRAHTLSNPIFVNVPPTYYEKHEKLILLCIIIGTILFGVVVYLFKRVRHMRKVHKAHLRYEKLYNKLHLIYQNTSVDLALYDAKGYLLFSITKETIGAEHNKGSGLFSDKIFECSDLSPQLKEELKNNHSINTEITVTAGEKDASSIVQERTYQLIVKPLENANAQCARYVAIAIDMHPVVREREERKRLETLVRFASDSSLLGIAFYDIKTGEGVATKSWYENLNEPFSKTLFPAYKSVADEDRRLLVQFHDKVQQGEVPEPLKKDICVYDTNGEAHWITQHIFVKEDEPNVLIELNLNIDERKHKERKLRKAKAEADHSIIETEQFLANINHEIRTPLNSIVGFSAILSEIDREERKEYISIILRNNTLLTNLIDDVIELSKIDAGQMDFTCEPVNVSELFERLANAHQAELHKKQLPLIQDLDEAHNVINSNPEALYRLLNNLLSNAVKFTSEGSITLGCRKEETSFYFYVKDTGIGITTEDQLKIFKRFDKLDAYVQGTGLGLALCKSIVENLGGEIGVESEKGKGSTFWFVLPFNPSVT